MQPRGQQNVDSIYFRIIEKIVVIGASFLRAPSLCFDFRFLFVEVTYIHDFGASVLEEAARVARRNASHSDYSNFEFVSHVTSSR
jgi:hypothetical protein